MELRKFYATSMQDALEAIRAELGEEAVILDSRAFTEPGAEGEPPVERVEVWVQCTAAPAPHPVPDETPAPVPDLLPPALPELPEETAGAALTEEPADDTPRVLSELDELRRQLDTVHSEMDVLRDGMGWMGVGSLGAGNALGQCIVEGLAGALTYSGGIRCLGLPHVVALIGPTGAGKTTMTARLTWHFAVLQGMSVGVIAADTHRVGAVDQVTRYCRHLEVPCEVVYTAEEIPEALERLADRALVLIDTPGVGQRNPALLEEIQALLLAADPAEVHLVMSANVSSATVRDVFHHYATLHPDQLILTKLDETPGLPELLPLAVGSGMAISYLSAGQQLDDGLHLASPEIILRYLGRG